MNQLEPLKVTLQNVVAATGESMPTVYRAIELGHLDTFLVGRRRFVRPAAVRKWVDFLETESNAGRPVVYRSRASEEKQKEAA